MAKTALVPIADGTEEMEAVILIDVLRRADTEVTVASAGELQVTASRGVKIVADALIRDCAGKSYDLIALPGGLPGAEHLRDCETLVELLKQQRQAGRLYGAICASPAVALAHHGLLDDKKATCYPGLQDKLPDASESEKRVVADGNCVTSQGPGTALDFALVLVERLHGSDKAQAIAQQTLAETR